MKIDFQTVNTSGIKNIKFPQNVHMSYVSNNSLKNDIYSPAFEGIQNKLAEKLENLQNVHCPACGTLMMTVKQFNKVMDRAFNIETKKDFFSILKDNEQYLNKVFKNIVNTMFKINEARPTSSLNEIFAMVRKGCNTNLDNVVKNQAEFIKLKIKDENLAPADKKLFENCAQRLTQMREKRISAKAFVSILHDTIINSNSPEKWDIYTKLKNDFTKAYMQRYVLKIPGEDEIFQAQSIIENIFKYSVSKANKINDDKIDNLDFNTILMCHKCSETKQNSIYKIIKTSNETMLNRYNTYLEDISSLILKGETGISDNYVIALINNFKKMSNGKIYVKNTASVNQIKQNRFVKRTPFEFKLVNEEGITCACCGKEAITHEKRLKIFDEIMKTENKQELLNLLKKYHDIIRDDHFPIIKDFEKILEECPNLSDNEIYKKLQNFANRRMRKTFTENEKFVKYHIMKQHPSPNDKKLIKEYIDNQFNYLSDLSNNELFRWYDYKKFLNNIIGKTESPKIGKYLEQIKYNVKKEFMAQYPLFPVKETLEKCKSPLKAIMQDIFKQTVATKDHFVALAKSGANDQKNIIVLCKNCNHLKGSTGTYNWLVRNKKNIRENLTKYFEVISTKIKNGVINSSYKDYLKELQMYIYKISDGKLDIDYFHNL